MKNSVWREYQRGVRLQQKIEKITGRQMTCEEFPDMPIKEKPDVTPWRCSWCGKPSPIGAAVCQNCGMPKLE
jgi:hypothetical protein